MLSRFISLLAVDTSPLPNIDTSTRDPLQTILYFVFVVMGGVSLIVIMISGIKFMTAQGEPQALAKARLAIIYAAIGLAVAISASTILNFVVGRIG
ncbi:hypothetical protein KC946_03955 [Candidatus Saccharibacteria bacterium]|nr:hypothetical protein [Candidatus Saccharibacteria bacterium]